MFPYMIGFYETDGILMKDHRLRIGYVIVNLPCRNCILERSCATDYKRRSAITGLLLATRDTGNRYTVAVNSKSSVHRHLQSVS